MIRRMQPQCLRERKILLGSGELEAVKQRRVAGKKTRIRTRTPLSHDSASFSTGQACRTTEATAVLQLF